MKITILITYFICFSSLCHSEVVLHMLDKSPPVKLVDEHLVEKISYYGKSFSIRLGFNVNYVVRSYHVHGDEKMLLGEYKSKTNSDKLTIEAFLHKSIIRQKDKVHIDPKAQVAGFGIANTRIYKKLEHFMDVHCYIIGRIDLNDKNREQSLFVAYHPNELPGLLMDDFHREINNKKAFGLMLTIELL